MVLTDEEKRQSLMKKTQDNRVEKGKADTDDLDNVEILNNFCHPDLCTHNEAVICINNVLMHRQTSHE